MGLFRLSVGVVAAILGGIVLAWEVAEAQGGPSAKLKIVRGGAGVLRGDGTPISPASSGLAIGMGDQVGTFARSDARIEFVDGSAMELGSETTVVFHELTVVNGGVSVVAEQSSGVVRHRVGGATYQSGGYRIVHGEYLLLVAPSNVAQPVDEEGERQLARLPIDPAAALALTASARRAADEADIVTLVTANGSSVSLVFGGELSFSRHQPDTGWGVTYTTQ